LPECGQRLKLNRRSTFFNLPMEETILLRQPRAGVRPARGMTEILQ
jgi:hypothetical protein